MESKPMMKRSGGQILILTALTLVVLIGMSALTIDLGMAYAVEAKLTSALDAASLAGGKAVKIGADDDTRRQNARNAATSFFAANFPTGIRGTTSSSFSVDSITNVEGTWTIRVSGTAHAPTFFSSMFRAPITVRASAQATVRTLDMMLVLDTSGSLDPPYSPAGTFAALRTAAINFVNGFQEGAGGDRIGLVTFASGAVLDDAINKNAIRGFTRLNLVNHINATTANGATNAEEAMRLARAELDAIPAEYRSTLRAIVFFSDGAPNIVSGTFRLSTGAITPPCGLYSIRESSTGGADNPMDCYPINQRSGARTVYRTASNTTLVTHLPVQDYTGTVNLFSFNNIRPLSGPPLDRTFRYINTWCNLNAASRNMVENIANAARGGAGTAAVTVYTIGLGSMLRSNEVTICGYGPGEYGENILRRLANTTDSDTYQSTQPTGLYVWAADASQLNSAFQRVRSAVLRLSK